MTFQERKYGLPKQPKHPNKSACGICESVKSDRNGVLQCPHCDIPCRNSAGACGICRAGLKGLPEPHEDSGR